jgi:hypothetical protein
MWIVIIALVLSILAIAGARQMFQEAVMGKPKQTRNPGRLYTIFAILSLGAATFFAFRAAPKSKPIDLVPLPPGVVALGGGPIRCSHPGCDRLATRIEPAALKEIMKEPGKSGPFATTRYVSTLAYCAEHSPPSQGVDSGDIVIVLVFSWVGLTVGMIVLYKGFIALSRILPTKGRLV